MTFQSEFYLQQNNNFVLSHKAPKRLKWLLPRVEKNQLGKLKDSTISYPTKRRNHTPTLLNNW